MNTNVDKSKYMCGEQEVRHRLKEARTSVLRQLVRQRVKKGSENTCKQIRK